MSRTGSDLTGLIASWFVEHLIAPSLPRPWLGPTLLIATIMSWIGLFGLDWALWLAPVGVLLVLIDCWPLTLSRLHLTRLPLTSLERWSFRTWAVVGLVVMPIVPPLYLFLRRRLHRAATLAETAGTFASDTERRSAQGTPGVFPSRDLAERRTRARIDVVVQAALVVGVVVAIFISDKPNSPNGFTTAQTSDSAPAIVRPAGAPAEDAWTVAHREVQHVTTELKNAFLQGSNEDTVSERVRKLKGSSANMRRIDISRCPPDFQKSYILAEASLVELAEYLSSADANFGSDIAEAMIRGACGDPLGKAQEQKSSQNAAFQKFTDALNALVESAATYGVRM